VSPSARDAECRAVTASEARIERAGTTYESPKPSTRVDQLGASAPLSTSQGVPIED